MKAEGLTTKEIEIRVNKLFKRDCFLSSNLIDFFSYCNGSKKKKIIISFVISGGGTPNMRIDKFVVLKMF
jgi:hypothetical protein